MDGYTSLTRAKFERATRAELTAEQAVEWLLSARDFRTLPEKLLKFFPGTADEMKKALRDGFFAAHADPKERESLRKSISNWFAPAKGIDDRVISRQYAFEICFILKLSEQRADELIRLVAGEGIRYRSLNEFVLAFALLNGLSLERANELANRAAELYGAPEQNSAAPEGYTSENRDAARELTSEAELWEYIESNQRMFSAYRNTAYEYFTDMLSVMLEEGEDASVEAIVERNLYRRFVEKRAGLSALQKSIFSGWPEETQLSKMKSRALPVSRKVLILLFLASGGGLSTQAPEDFDAYFESEADFDDSGDADFTAMFIQLNAMLIECGFAPIDPRAPFDWMTLFCMATGDVFNFDERFEGVLSRLAGNAQQPRRE